MKKRYFPTFLLSVLCFSAFAQQIGELPARWTYFYDGFWVAGPTIVEHDGTAEVDGLTYTRLSRVGIWSSRAGSSGPDTLILPPLLLRSENGIVSGYDGEMYIDTLINFNTTPGNYWKIDFGPEELAAVVTDTGHVDMLGRSLKWMGVNYHWFFNGAPEELIYQDTIFEQIGNTNDYLLPWDYFYRGIDGGQGGQLLCYEEQGEVTIFFNGTTCTPPVNTSVPVADNSLNCTPNPFHHELTLTSETPIQSVSVVDLAGRSVLQAKCNASDTSYRLNTSTLPAGLYWVIVKNDDGKTAIRKVVRQ